MNKIDMLFDKIFHCLTAVSFGAVSVCALVQVVTRYTPGISAPWTDEMTRLFFMYTVMFGAPMAIKYSEYAVIDVITANIHGFLHHALQIVIHLLIAVFCIVGTKQALLLYKTGLRTVSASLQLPMNIFYAAPVGIFLLTAVYCVIRAVQEIIKIGKGEK